MVLVPLQGPVAGGMELLVGFGLFMAFVALILVGIVKLVSGAGGTSKYCENCEQNVNAAKGFSWVIFLLLMIFGLGFGAILYVVYYLVVKSKTCPICGDQHFGPPQQARTQQVQD